MAVSVRMDPLLERELDAAAKRKGITKSQFITQAVERALDRTDPFELMRQAKAELAADPNAQTVAAAFAQEPCAPYDTDRSRAALIARLRAKHGLSPA